MGCVDARLHQGDADALAALMRFDRQGPQQQKLIAADPDRPETHRAAQSILGRSHKTKPGDGRDAFAQAIGGFGETAGTEAFGVQRLDGVRVARLFGADMPKRSRGIGHGVR
jgi:hypothetical protein